MSKTGDWWNEKPLEDMKLPPGFYWASLPLGDRYKAVLCHERAPHYYCKDEADARVGIEKINAWLAANEQVAA